MSEPTFVTGDAMRLHAPCKEIRGDTTHFIDLFHEMARRYPSVRITAEPDGGVALRFEGSWAARLEQETEFVILPDNPEPPRPASRSWFTRFRAWIFGASTPEQP